MNEFEKQIIAFFEAQLGKPYKFGALGPDEWDCRGLDRKGARFAGLDASVFPAVNTVTEMAAWAKANGRLRAATVTPEPGWFFLWGPADGSAPVKGAGHTGVVLEAPSAAHPHGLAISAYDPALGVIQHRLIPKPANGHALYGYVELAWPSTPVDPPITAPLTPPPPAAVDSPTVADLLAKIAAAKEALA